MRWIALAFVCAAAGFAQEDPTLPRVKQNALANLERLPDYVCTQAVERFIRPRRARSFKRQDRVTFELAFIGGKELYAWPGEGSFTKETPHALLGYGMSNTGPFGLHVRAIFDYATTIRYAGEESVAGRRVARYDYTAPASTSPIQLTIGKASGEAGSRGSFWADPETYDIIRIEVQIEDIPASIDVGSAVDRVTYARVNLDGREVLLPAAAEMEMTDRAGNASRNVSEFTACRHYTTASSISFSEPTRADAPPPVETRALPPDLPLTLALESGIDESNTTVGTVVRARVAERSGPVPKDARVTGLVRRIGGQVVVIEFREIEYGRFRAPFRAALMGATGSVFNPMPEGGPGVAAVPLPLPRGFVTRWLTER